MIYPTNSSQTLTLSPSTKSVNPFQVTIAGAAYGNDSTDVIVAPDGLSVTIHVNSGTDSLVLAVVSPNSQDEALLTQSGTTIYQFVLTQHSDDCRLYIKGTP
jgi:hypothetical protein